MATSFHLGQQGEQWACDFLVRQGYVIVERNYRYRRAEVDIIARKDQRLVFVEVKTRSGGQFGEPEMSVDSTKESLVISAAEKYIEQTGWQYDIRFDIIAIRVHRNAPQITHLEDAFY